MPDNWFAVQTKPKTTKGARWHTEGPTGGGAHTYETKAEAEKHMGAYANTFDYKIIETTERGYPIEQPKREKSPISKKRWKEIKESYAEQHAADEKEKALLKGFKDKYGYDFNDRYQHSQGPWTIGKESAPMKSKAHIDTEEEKKHQQEMIARYKPKPTIYPMVTSVQEPSPLTSVFNVKRPSPVPSQYEAEKTTYKPEKTFYLVYQSAKGIWNYHTYTEKKLLEYQKTKEYENLKNFFITSDANELRNFMQQQSKQRIKTEKEFGKEYPTTRYQQAQKYAERAGKGIQQFEKGFLKQLKFGAKREEPQIRVEIPYAQNARSHFYAPENQSPLSKEHSEFGPSVLPPRFVSKNQSFINKPPLKIKAIGSIDPMTGERSTDYKPLVIGKRNEITGERSTNFNPNPFIIGKKDIITGERKTNYKLLVIGKRDIITGKRDIDYYPKVIGQRNPLTGERSTNYKPIVTGKKDIITGERQTMYKIKPYDWRKP